MRQKEKLKKYRDLLVPLCHCPFTTAKKDCPFVKLREAEVTEGHESLINNLSPEQLDKLREHHRACFIARINNGEVVIHG